MDRWPNHDFSGRRVLLEPGGEVQWISGRHGCATKWVSDDHLAGLDTDPDLEGDAVPLGGLRRQFGKCVSDRECRPDRAFGGQKYGEHQDGHGCAFAVG